MLVRFRGLAPSSLLPYAHSYELRYFDIAGDDEEGEDDE